MSKTIFEKVISREIKADIVYEDNWCIAFHDINPQAPVHVLLVTKKVIPKLSEASEEDAELLGHLMLKVADVTHKLNIKDNFRVVINNGPMACQTVYHLHIHILSGRMFHWPPG
ncbi:MAG: histidine triad nucleotide-binding protein [Gammaproteobacteria bacterium]|jgi:histidine triad (HIT) family protein|nr:histidine triad nucleotide-binding protein [Gammaproteobacteria bacterium]